jgi:hypothetical protein
VGVDARSSGVGDIQEQLYITPAVPGKLIWGVGPMLSLPTATADASRTGSWALGPGAVVLAMHGKWVYGGLVQQFWTMADTGDDPERTTVFSGRPMQLGIQYYHNVIRPDGSPSTQLRMIVSLLYPTKK